MATSWPGFLIILRNGCWQFNGNWLGNLEICLRASRGATVTMGGGFRLPPLRVVPQLIA
jgi:hypothetical protein